MEYIDDIVSAQYMREGAIIDGKKIITVKPNFSSGETLIRFEKGFSILLPNEEMVTAQFMVYPYCSLDYPFTIRG